MIFTLDHAKLRAELQTIWDHSPNLTAEEIIIMNHEGYANMIRARDKRIEALEAFIDATSHHNIVSALEMGEELLQAQSNERQTENQVATESASGAPESQTK